MKHSKLLLILLCPVFFLFSGCKNCDCEPEQKDETPSTENQPADPKAFSLVGKTYLRETTWRKSPAYDEYWAMYLTFPNDSVCIKIQTSNRDLTPHEDFMDLVETFSYKLSYPNLTLAFGVNEGYLTFIDTLTLYTAAEDETYYLH